MLEYLIFSPWLVFFAFFLWSIVGRGDCPDCGAVLPPFLSPFRKTRRMWLAGGSLCARCGCETDRAGRKVTLDTPMPRFPTQQVAVVGVLLAMAIGLVSTVVALAGRPVAAQPIVVVPVLAPVPLAVPAT